MSRMRIEAHLFFLKEGEQDTIPSGGRRVSDHLEIQSIEADQLATGSEGQLRKLLSKHFFDAVCYLKETWNFSIA